MLWCHNCTITIAVDILKLSRPDQTQPDPNLGLTPFLVLQLSVWRIILCHLQFLSSPPSPYIHLPSSPVKRLHNSFSLSFFLSPSLSRARSSFSFWDCYMEKGIGGGGIGFLTSGAPFFQSRDFLSTLKLRTGPSAAMESSSVEVDFFSDEKKKKRSRLERVDPELDLKVSASRLGIKKEDLTINVSKYYYRSIIISLLSYSFYNFYVIVSDRKWYILLHLVTAYDDWQYWKRSVNGGWRGICQRGGCQRKKRGNYSICNPIHFFFLFFLWASISSFDPIFAHWNIVFLISYIYSQLAAMQAELGRMNEENQRLRGMLNQVTSNYNALHMHLISLMQQKNTRNVPQVLTHLIY